MKKAKKRRAKKRSMRCWVYPPPGGSVTDHFEERAREWWGALPIYLEQPDAEGRLCDAVSALLRDIDQAATERAIRICELQFVNPDTVPRCHEDQDYFRAWNQGVNQCAQKIREAAGQKNVPPGGGA